MLSNISVVANVKLLTHVLLKFHYFPVNFSLNPLLFCYFSQKCVFQCQAFLKMSQKIFKIGPDGFGAYLL